MADEANDPAQSPSQQNAQDEPKSWAHQLGVGVALVLVSFFFLPEGIGAVRGEGGSFLYRADAGEPEVFFGGALIVLGVAMLCGGLFFIVRGLRKRNAERNESK